MPVVGAPTDTKHPGAPGNGALARGQADLLVATGIAKSFRRGVWPLQRRQPVLRGVDLTLHPGEVVGLVRENGSGKSTLMKILVGALAADSGSVTVTAGSGTAPSCRWCTHA